MDISDIYRILPHRYTDALDRLADFYLPDVESSGNRLADAMERIAEHMGAFVKSDGDRTLNALEAIVDVVVDGKKHETATLNDISSLMSGSEEKFVISLTEDIDAGSVDSAITVPAGKRAIIDLNGHEITGKNVLLNVEGGEAIVRNGSFNSNGKTIRVSGGGKLTVEDAEITSTRSNGVNLTDAGTSFTFNSGKIRAQEFGVIITFGSEFVMNGGIVEGVDNCAIGGNGTDGQGNITMTINGGTLVGHIKTEGYIACGIYHPNSGTLNFNGGEIISDGCGICMRGGTVNLNGGKIKAKGEFGVDGMVGDSRVVVGPYAVVYDESAKYPAVDTMELNIAKGANLYGTDGDLQILLSDGATANINDRR